LAEELSFLFCRTEGGSYFALLEIASSFPVIPSIPETSPVEELPFLIKGYPGMGSKKAMVLRTQMLTPGKDL
jgi:hypothetical protein